MISNVLGDVTFQGVLVVVAPQTVEFGQLWRPQGLQIDVGACYLFGIVFSYFKPRGLIGGWDFESPLSFSHVLSPFALPVHRGAVLFSVFKNLINNPYPSSMALG